MKKITENTYAMGDYSIWRTLAHKVKDGNEDAIRACASLMAREMEFDFPCVLVGMPSHNGDATYTDKICKILSETFSIPFIPNALCGLARESQYELKKKGKIITADEMPMFLCSELPENCTPIVIDNVIASGETAKAALNAMPEGTRIYALAFDNPETRWLTIEESMDREIISVFVEDGVKMVELYGYYYCSGCSCTKNSHDIYRRVYPRDLTFKLEDYLAMSTEEIEYAYCDSRQYIDDLCEEEVLTDWKNLVSTSEFLGTLTMDTPAGTYILPPCCYR